MFENYFRKLVQSRLHNLRDGILAVQEGQQTHLFGDADSTLKAQVVINDPAFYRAMVTGGGLGAAESLARGEWSCDDLTSLVRILVRNLPQGDTANGPFSLAKNALAKAGHFLRRNTVSNAKQNIVKHYDLSNEFFALFLDPSMAYSSAIFLNPQDTLYQGSMEKIDRACRKLNLQGSDHLLEIGTGWGGLAVHAAKHYGCQVTTTTISDQQHAFAQQRIRDEGLEDQITLLKQDYRKLTGTYDKLVTIEMIEAVGHQYFDTFFQKCGQLLKPEGEMLMQAITITDHRFEHHKRTVDFIKKYIFPGGCLPSVTALSESMARESRLRMVHMEDFASHYAETLRRWRSAFFDQIEAVRALGFDDRFIRIWDYYLCYCEAAFMERHVNVTQLWFVNHASKTSPLDRELQLLPSQSREQGRSPRSEADRTSSKSKPGVEINEVVA
ncbi:MAG: cyclopropane-fatty-acyl-phospholipid synthase [Pirellulaceae bacterium]|nr:cyclopropane-fatty-acyl-phospholipid synthase [Pirellulaceae bacterium]